MSIVAHLWLAILLSAVLVFALSAASHMVLPWRRNEWRRISESGALQAALRDLAPGLYAFPAPSDPKQQMSKEWMERWAKGPSGWLTLAPPGPVRMGRNMMLSFLVYLVVGFLVAYVAAHSLPAAPRFRAVFRIVGAVGFLSYGVGTIFNSIWYHRPWRAYLADFVDALLFGLVTAAVFGWLWPS
ncbi:MAG TPA: hypothetical protein VFG59_06055 [Anaeromyxobacter sp.]|nr:hypothetical protein [Anaeromyxobacter sp.]